MTYVQGRTRNCRASRFGNLFGRSAATQVNRGHSLPPPPSASAQCAATAAPPRAAPAAEPGEDVWHLRARPNGAALSCRGKGRTSVVSPYSQVLSRHKALLAKAYVVEQRRHGKGLDRHQTQFYNQFSNQRNPIQFCARSASVAKRAAAMDSPALAANARSLLGEID